MPLYFAPFCILLIISFLYKVSLDSKIMEPEKNESIFSILAFKKYGIEDLFPLSTRNGDAKEKKLRVKANIALVVFYNSFLIIILLSMLVK